MKDQLIKTELGLDKKKKKNVIPPLPSERCRFQPSVSSSLLMLKKDYLTLVPGRADCRQGAREVREGLWIGGVHVACQILEIAMSHVLVDTGYPLKLYFQIPCVFLVRPQIFPVRIYLICDYYIHRTDLTDLSSFWGEKWIFLRQLLQYPLLLESELHDQLTKFPVFRQNSLCFDKISEFPVFSLIGNFFGNFPCAVGTL